MLTFGTRSASAFGGRDVLVNGASAICELETRKARLVVKAAAGSKKSWSSSGSNSLSSKNASCESESGGVHVMIGSETCRG
jgi:hypothetical protein